MENNSPFFRFGVVVPFFTVHTIIESESGGKRPMQMKSLYLCIWE